MSYRFSNLSNPAITALIIINAVIFVLLVILSFKSSYQLTEYLSLSASPAVLLSRPWTIVSYAFTQANIIQLLFNMLWLFSFGRLMILRCSSLELISTYLSGAVIGGATFIAFSSVIGSNAAGILMGSSAAVIAIAVAVAVIMPDNELYLPLIGPTKIKWIVVIVVILFCIGLSAPNAGGNLAHLGGAAAGAMCGGIILRRYKSLSRGAGGEYNSLVEKIKRSGYDTLSTREKRRFFELSNRRHSK